MNFLLIQRHEFAKSVNSYIHLSPDALCTVHALVLVNIK